jgi:hypothetical protein
VPPSRYARASRSDKERDEAFRIYDEKRDVLVKKGELPASMIMPSTQQEWDAAKVKASQERKAKRRNKALDQREGLT